MIYSIDLVHVEGNVRVPATARLHQETIGGGCAGDDQFRTVLNISYITQMVLVSLGFTYETI